MVSSLLKILIIIPLKFSSEKSAPWIAYFFWTAYLCVWWFPQMPDIPGSLLTHGSLHSPHTHAWRWCLYMADLITGEHMASWSCHRPSHASVGGLNSSSGFSNLLLRSSISTGVGFLRKGYVASHPRDGDFHFILLLSRCDSPTFLLPVSPSLGLSLSGTYSGFLHRQGEE